MRRSTTIGIALGLGLGFVLLRPARAMGRRAMIKANIPMVRALVQKWSAIFNRVPAETIMAVIGNESGFNPHAVNNTGGDAKRGGAWGLGQITLKTALGLPLKSYSKIPAIESVARRWDRTGPGLLEPDLNIMLVMMILNANMKELNDVDLAVAAYNRGIGAVRTMVAEGRTDFVRKLDYVMHVVAMRQEISKLKTG